MRFNRKEPCRACVDGPFIISKALKFKRFACALPHALKFILSALPPPPTTWIGVSVIVRGMRIMHTGQ